MITYKPIIIPGGRRKDGTHPVKIRVTFKGVSRRLPTTLVCTDADLTRSGRIKNADILRKADNLIARMRSCTEDLSPFTLETWDVDRVVAEIRRGMEGDAFRLDFFSFADNYLTESKTPSNRKGYDVALNAFARFLGERRLDVNEITRAQLLDFIRWQDETPAVHRIRGGAVTETSHQKIRGATSTLYLGRLSHIYEAARFKYNDEDSGRILIPRSPFSGLRKTYTPEGGQEAQSVETIQALLDDIPRTDGLLRIALASFAVSLGTMGANMADLWAARSFEGDTWTYNRQKTVKRRADRAKVVVLLPEVIRPCLGLLCSNTETSGWWLGALHRWKDATSATAAINRQLAQWCRSHQIPVFTFGAARHTWGTQARRLGVEKATVDDGMAHRGDYRVLDIYAEKNWRLTWDANERVLAQYRWPSQLTA